MSADKRPKVVDERAQRVIRDTAKTLEETLARVKVLVRMLDGHPDYTNEPKPVTEFTLTADHVKLLRHANVGWNPCEWGGPEIDPKRPFGNGDMWQDVARILGWSPVADLDNGDFYAYYDEARAIHAELGTALQIVLATGSFEPGRYVYRAPPRLEAVVTPWEVVSDAVAWLIVIGQALWWWRQVRRARRELAEERALLACVLAAHSEEPQP